MRSPAFQAKRYGLTSQLRRAAVSVGASIAEGHTRQGNRELRRFLDISLGSLAEIRHLLVIASDLGYIDSDGNSRIDAQLHDTSRVGVGSLQTGADDTRPVRLSGCPAVRLSGCPAVRLFARRAIACRRSLIRRP
ncbi:MAG: four helix bundle protein [Gemmatimonadales bacterium]